MAAPIVMNINKKTALSSQPSERAAAIVESKYVVVIV